MSNKKEKIGLLRRLNHKRLDYFRKLRNDHLLNIYYHFYERWRKKYPLARITEFSSCCINMLGTGIGDAIVVSGFISALRKAQKKVYVICYPRQQQIFKDLIETDGVYILDAKKPQYKDVMDLDIEADVVIDFADPEKHLHKRILALMAIEHKYSIGINQEDTRFFDLNLERDEKGTHWSDRLIAVADALGVKIEDFQYDLHFGKLALDAVEAFVKSMGGDYILFNPTASDKNRSLSSAFISETLSFLLKNTSSKVVVLNVQDQELIKAYPDVIFNPFTGLEENLLLVGKCRLIISTDTSFIHAANFFKVRLIGIYNNRLANGKYNNNELWGPHYANAVQVFSQDHDGTESGDDLRNLPFKVLKDVLAKEV